MKKRILALVTTSLLAIALVGCNELKDPRDGKIYRTVKIGKQVWMAENLNYKTEGSYCYQDNPANCKKYGRLYTWNAAYEACPVGWHLPSRSEYRILFQAVGGRITDGENWTGVANSLKSQSGWDKNGNGADSFGFSVLPAGYRDGNEYRNNRFENEGTCAYLWSSTELQDDRDYAYGVYLGIVHFQWEDKTFGFSVRCVKD